MPRDFELTEFEKLYKSYNVTDVVRTCEECHYSDDWLKSQGIQSHVRSRIFYHFQQFVFADGSIPPEDVVTRFIGLCESRFGPESKNPKATISVRVAVWFLTGRFIARLVLGGLLHSWRLRWSRVEWRIWRLSKLSRTIVMRPSIRSSCLHWPDISRCARIDPTVVTVV